MVTLVNRAKVATATTGTGTITLGSAESGYQTFAAAGVANADVVRYVIEDGDNWEIGTGTYTASGTTLTRTVIESSNADAAINLTGSAVVFVGVAAEDILQPANNLSDLASASTARTNLGLGTAATTAATAYATAAQGTTADNALPKAGGAITGAITTSSTFDGRDVSTDGRKLDGIETGATADQTGAQIKTAYQAEANAFTDAQFTKLSGIEASADVTDATNVTAAGALMDSEVTNLAQVKAFSSADYATAAQGTLANSSVQPNDNATLGNVSVTSLGVTGTVDGRDVAADGTKLDTVETNADVTDATNVTVAGALMDSEVTNLAEVKAFSSADYATAAQGSTADAALPKAGGAMTGAITTSSTFDGRDVAADGTKLDYITVTQAVSLDQMEIDIAALANGMVYKGDWSAASGSFPGSGAAQTGWFYYVSGAGTVNGITFAIGDNIIATTDNASATTYSGNWSKHDQTDAVQSVVGLSGSITKSALLSALNVEDGADVTDATNVTAAGALMDSEVANLAQVKAFDTTAYATAAQGTLATNALPKSGGALTGAVTTSSTFDGRDVSVDGGKLDGIETGATADQTAAQIKTAYESNANTNEFSDAEQTKLSGIEASADVTDTTNVTSAGALMDSEVTNLAQVKTFSSADYATAAQGTTADAALPKVGGALTGAVTTSSTFDGRDVSVDGAKLDGIATGATNTVGNATHTGEVTGSGALTIAADVVDAGNLKVTGNGTTSQYLRSDGDGTFSWVTPPNTTYSVGDGGLSQINFTSADNTKLDGIEASANVTDTANVTSAGALMDSEVTNLAQVKAFSSSDYATSTQGTTADNALPKSGGALTGAVTTNSTFDGRDVATDGAKLDGIEAGATTDQTAAQILTAIKTVDGAGSGLDADLLDGLSSASFATSAQGTLASNALPKAGGALTGAVTTSSTFDGRNVSVDGAKLDGIAAGATNTVGNATHTGEVTGSGALTIASNVVDADNLKVTGNGTTSQYLRSDADGTFTWATPPNTTYSVGDGGLTQINFTSADNTKLDGIAAGATNTVGNATHTGEVTGSGALTIASNVVDEANLKVSNAPTNGYMLTAQSGNTGGLTWAAAPTSSTAFGAVGTYCLGFHTGLGVHNGGATFAGGNIRTANTYAGGGGTSGSSTSTLTGTWRLMGNIGYYNGGSTASNANVSGTLFVRTV